MSEPARDSLDLRPLGVLLALALGVRLATLWLLPWLSPEPGYAGAAKAVADGQPFWSNLLWVFGPDSGTLRPPSFQVYLAALFKLFGAAGALPALAHHLLGLITTILLYLLAGRLWGGAAAALAGALYVLDPSVPLFDSLGLSETLMVPLVLAALYGFLLLTEMPRPSWTAAAAVGACGAAAALCRPGFALFAPLVLLFSGRRASALAAAGVCLALTGGWALRNQVFFGHLTLSSNFAFSALGNTYPLVDYESPSFPEAKAALREAWEEHRREPRGDVAMRARDLLKSRHGMSEDQASQLMRRAWQEAVRAHPAAFLRYWAGDAAFLFLPPRRKFVYDIAEEFRTVYPERWPPAVVARLCRLGFMDRVGAVIAAAWQLKRVVAWLSLAGMAGALALGWGGGAALFLLANYAACLLLYALATGFSPYYFELHPFQVLFAAAALSRLWGSGGFDALKPRREQILPLALRETDPRRYREFALIARGPLFAAAALAALAAAAPFLMLYQRLRPGARARP